MLAVRVADLDAVEPERAPDVHPVPHVPGVVAPGAIERRPAGAEDFEGFGLVQDVLVERLAVDLPAGQDLLHEDVQLVPGPAGTAGRGILSSGIQGGQRQRTTERARPDEGEGKTFHWTSEEERLGQILDDSRRRQAGWGLRREERGGCSDTLTSFMSKRLCISLAA